MSVNMSNGSHAPSYLSLANCTSDLLSDVSSWLVSLKVCFEASVLSNGSTLATVGFVGLIPGIVSS